MKKIFAIAMTCIVAAGVTVGATAYALNEDNTAKAAEKTIYLVPGSYADKTSGQTVYNTVGSGAKKLTDEECESISTENAYICQASAGEKLPVPATEREGYSFNGWWTIVNASVVYYETVPAVEQATYFYADWRAALSQPMDPVNPSDDEEEEIPYYMQITRAETGKTEIVALNVSGTDVSSETLGYGGPVQLYNEWFLLQPGDVMEVYVSRLYGDEPTLAPQLKEQRYITLESSGNNRTRDYLLCRHKADNDLGYSDSAYGNYTNEGINAVPQLVYVGDKATEEHYFRIYIKFYDDGGVMTVYIEQQN